MSMEFILDGVVMIFLAVLIGYCIVLNNRLKKFRGAQNEMAQLVAQLSEATDRAQNSISMLKNSIGDEEARLAELLTRSRKMADELSVITDVGANLADRLEKGLLPESDPTGADDLVDEEQPEEAEEELLENLRNVR
ncbi:DUF6468 domain-containing protein [Emcibacter sp.]|uniref:DUF6468 domain-containing protein n=1 Tax=Emcibacter sp. TaxID=1979954 RepID=UPI002AA6D139|nr:DUF6468 domain-containing protein [Emcibacter sp.]